MPQGKPKAKGKLAAAAAPAKSKRKGAKKGSAVTKRKGRPISPKKQQHEEAQKLKKIITKSVNQVMEDDLRAKALDGRKSLVAKKDTAGPAQKKKRK